MIPNALRTSRQILILLTLAVLSLVTLAQALSASAASASSTLTVDSALDVEALDGVCTLREAIQAVNTNATVNECTHDGSAGTDTIAFAIGAAGSQQTITLNANLPTITEAVVLDAWSQGGAGYTGPPLIELNGENLTSSGARGLRIDSGGTTVRGFVINRFDAVSGAGIWLRKADGNWIAGNYIGTSTDGNTALPNHYGIWIDNWGNSEPSNDNIIGTNGDGVDDAFEGNVIAGSVQENVRVETSGNWIAGNHIGTNAAGNAGFSTNNTGIRLYGSSSTTTGDNNVVGTNGDGVSDDLERNLISGQDFGVGINNSSGHTIAGNIIGLDTSGTGVLGNDFNGIDCAASSTPSEGIRIGSDGDGVSDELEANVISGNGSRGYSTFDGGCRHITIQGNKIGTDHSGTVALGNGAEGIIISSGDWYTITHNIISGNGTNGMAPGVSTSGADNVTVMGNIIGSDASGTLDLGNTGHGLLISFSDSQVLRNNQISGNGGDGVLVSGADGTLIEDNLIGLQADGLSDLGNANHGTFIHGDSVGSVLRRNTIAYNGGHGVVVDGNQAFNHSLSANAIFANDDLGIDLDLDGVTSNDPDDGDTGPNGLQNYPVLDFAESAVKGQAVISGTLDSLPGTTFTLEFFYSPAADATGHGEGQVYLGSGQTATDGGSDASFQFTLGRTIPPNAYITATATDPAGATSEFSAAYGPASGILDDPISSLTAACTPASCEIPAGTTIELAASITGGTGVAYIWDLGDGWKAPGQAITHTYTAPGAYTATVAASNNNDVQTSSVLVTVLDPNQPPVADAGPDQSVPAGSLVALEGTGSSDPGGNVPLAYAWVQTAGPAVSLSDPGAAQPTFTAPYADAVLTFELVVTNTLDLQSDPDPVTITVEAREMYLPIILK